MIVAIIVLSIACLVFAYLAFIADRHAPAALPAGASRPVADVDVKARQQAEAELEKKRRELEETKTQMNALRAELKQAKRKIFDQREASKDTDDLQKARAEVERGASLQLESVRAELASALNELAKLKAESVGGKSRRPAGATALVEAHTLAAAPLELPVAEPAPVVREPPKRVIRELSEADKAKIDRAEHQASRDRAKTAELEKEVRRLKGRNETQHRVYTVTKSELDLVKDKFKALEKRLNRTLLERDLVRRAIKDLEKSSGVAAPRTELTADELAASDQGVEERQRAEAAEVERRAAEARTPEPEAPPAAEPEAPAEKLH